MSIFGIRVYRYKPRTILVIVRRRCIKWWWK